MIVCLTPFYIVVSLFLWLVQHLLRQENLAFDIDVWYRCVEKHTFPSVFLPLNLPEAAAMVKHYDCVWRKKKDHRFSCDDIRVLRYLSISHNILELSHAWNVFYIQTLHECVITCDWYDANWFTTGYMWLKCV